MRRPAPILAAAALALAGCAPAVQPTTVEPGDGPADTAPATSAPPPGTAVPDSFPTEEPTEEEMPEEGPTEEPSDEESQHEDPQVATFDEKYTYEDGVQIEITKIVKGRFTGAEGEYADTEKKGDSYAKLTARVRNGSKKTVNLSASATVSYGPDGEEAVKSYLLDSDSGLDGKLIPGKSRSAVAVYLIPEKYWGDVVMEFTPDFEHESAVFSGSIK